MHGWPHTPDKQLVPRRQLSRLPSPLAPASGPPHPSPRSTHIPTGAHRHMCPRGCTANTPALTAAFDPGCCAHTPYAYVYAEQRALTQKKLEMEFNKTDCADHWHRTQTDKHSDQQTVHVQPAFFAPIFYFPILGLLHIIQIHPFPHLWFLS